MQEKIRERRGEALRCKGACVAPPMIGGDRWDGPAAATPWSRQMRSAALSPCFVTSLWQQRRTETGLAPHFPLLSHLNPLAPPPPRLRAACRSCAPVYLAAVLEYFAAEILELAGNARARQQEAPYCAAPPAARHPQRREAGQGALPLLPALIILLIHVARSSSPRVVSSPTSTPRSFQQEQRKAKEPPRKRLDSSVFTSQIFRTALYAPRRFHFIYVYNSSSCTGCIHRATLWPEFPPDCFVRVRPSLVSDCCQSFLGSASSGLPGPFRAIVCMLGHWAQSRWQ
ncbi:hypothetical protein DFH06DRAFT_517940 [Mycena polygramma]|nr:hypothetical protein DFH06DRAFT_517940 [Mycena polygramma]